MLILVIIAVSFGVMLRWRSLRSAIAVLGGLVAAVLLAPFIFGLLASLPRWGLVLALAGFLLLLATLSISSSKRDADHSFLLPDYDHNGLPCGSQSVPVYSQDGNLRGSPWR